MGVWEKLSGIKCFLFDMDGTVNLGDALIPGMEGFFEKLRASGRLYYFLTNNSSRDHAHYAKKMTRLGVPVGHKDIIISSDALSHWLLRTMPGAKLFVLGTPQLRAIMAAAGFILVDCPEEHADYVVVGFDQTLTYRRLTVACRLIDRGVPYVATHPDVRCPIEDGEFIPDAGAMIELLRTATGRAPELILGKPYRYMADVVLERTGLKKRDIAIVGDRLSTDIAFGRDNGFLSVLVLTGETTAEDVERGAIKPDIILPHAKEILQYLG